MQATAVGCGQAEETLNAGLKLHEAGKPKEAIREYDRAIKANPKLAEAYFNGGNVHYDLSDNEHATNKTNVDPHAHPRDTPDKEHFDVMQQRNKTDDQVAAR